MIYTQVTANITSDGYNAVIQGTNYVQEKQYIAGIICLGLIIFALMWISAYAINKLDKHYKRYIRDKQRQEEYIEWALLDELKLKKD